jgi:hypothetical protein
MDEVRDAWDAFCLAHPDAWFWSTTRWLDYLTAMRGGENLSVAVLNDADEVATIMPLILEGDEFAGGGDPLPWPVGRSNDEHTCRLIQGMANGYAAARRNV